MQNSAVPTRYHASYGTEYKKALQDSELFVFNMAKLYASHCNFYYNYQSIPFAV
jgi:hypothetical protein